MAGSGYDYEGAPEVFLRPKAIATPEQPRATPPLSASNGSEGYEEFTVIPAASVAAMPFVPPLPISATSAPPQEAPMPSISAAPTPAPTALTLSKDFPAGSPSTLRLSGSAPNAQHAPNDWNARFLRILDRVSVMEATSDNNSDAQRLWRELATLGEDFSYCAQTYGRIIISEVALGDAEKTIKPLQMGGVLGGAKYVVGNILFKFALDSAGLFKGDDECAAKVANLDLRGLEHLLSTSSRIMAYPLIALIDYRGFRLLAISLLPIGAFTLVCGSSTGNSAGVVNSDPEAHKELERVSKLLNLAPHRVGGDTLFMAADLEIHRSTQDKRLYAVDFSRTFPPEKPTVKGTNYLYQQLRPELVRRYAKPLNADAFSGFGSKEPDYADHCSVVGDATDHLYQKLIPRLAFDLSTQFGSAQRKVEAEPKDDSHTHNEGTVQLRLVRLVHEAGINLRHLGHVRRLLRPEEHALRTVLLIEMLARTARVELKKRLRTGIRDAKLALQGLCKDLVVEYVNQLLGSDFANDASRTHWAPLRRAVAVKFPEALLPAEESGEANMRQLLSGFNAPVWAVPESLGSLIATSHAPSDATPPVSVTGIALFFERLSTLCGLHWREGTLLRVNKPSQLRLSKPLSLIDLVDLEEKVKTLSLFTFAVGASVFEEAMKHHASDFALFTSVAKQAVDHLERSLDAFGSSGRTRRLLGRVWAMLNQPESAEKMLTSAIDVGVGVGGDIAARLWYAQFLDTTNRYAEMHSQLEQSLISGTTLKACVEFSVARCRTADVVEAMLSGVQEHIPAQTLQSVRSSMQRRLNLRSTGAATPHKTVIKEQRRFACPATSIWALVGNFSHLHSWHSAVLSTVHCTKGSSVGSIRTYRLRSGTLVSDRLVSLNAEQRTMSYTPVGRYIVWPLQTLRETITVKEQAEGDCIVEWEADTEHLTSSSVVETALGGFYAAGLQHLETILIKSKQVLPAQTPSEMPVWLRLAGIANRLKTSTVPAAVAELAANNPALDEVVISALYEWAEDPQRKAQMSTPDVIPLLLATAQRSPHCVQLVRTLFRLLLKLSRNSMLAALGVFLSHLDDAGRVLAAQSAHQLAAAMLKTHPTDPPIVQNCLVVFAHIGNSSTDTLDLRKVIFETGAIDFGLAALKLGAQDRLTSDRAIFLFSQLCHYAPAAEELAAKNGVAAIVESMTRFNADSELLQDACAALRVLVATRGAVAAAVRSSALGVLMKSLASANASVREAALTTMDSFCAGVMPSLSDAEREHLNTAVGSSKEALPNLRSLLEAASKEAPPKKD